MEMSKQGREWMRQWREINAGTAPPNWRENPPPPLAEIVRYELDRVRRGIPPEEADLDGGGSEASGQHEIPVERVVKRFGLLTRSRRTVRGMRQSDLARHSGISRVVIGRIESGAQPPRLNEIVGIARALASSPSQMVRAAAEVTAEESEVVAS